MDRRSFIRIGVAGAATGIIAPQIVLAGPLKKKMSAGNMAGGVFYTKEAPGRWKKKAGAHSPIITKTDAGVQVVTGHPMKANDHWIIKHVLLDSDFNFIAQNMFNPSKDKAAISDFSFSDRPGYSGAVYALSVCNKHDSWLSVLEV